MENHHPTRSSRRRHRRTVRRRLAATALLISAGAGVALASWTGGQSAGPTAASPVSNVVSPSTDRTAPASGSPSPTVPADAASGIPASPSAPTSASPSRTADNSAKSSTPASPPKSGSGQSGTSAQGSGSGGTAAAGDAPQRVLDLINKTRAGQGLPALTLLGGLNGSAALHNQAMASGCGLSHQCPGEENVGKRENAQGVNWSSAGENIGTGGPVSGATAVADMAVQLTQDMIDERPPNDGHRRNILSTSFTHIGIAVHQDGSGTVWLTQDFSN